VRSRAQRAIKMRVSDCVDTALTRAPRRACPLPGQRLSIFSVFRKAVHANAQLFCSFGPQDRENRQPLDRERDLKDWERENAVPRLLL
jgi:hypothetical protein